MEPEGAPLKYEYSAVIELEEGASLEDLQALNSGSDFQAFVEEYEHLLEAETHLYFGHEVECKAAQSKEKFWASR